MSSLKLSGGVRDIVEIANGLTRRGHLITFITPGGTVDDVIRSEIHPAARIIETALAAPKDPHRANPFYLLRLSWQLARAVPQSDIIISTQTPTTFAGWLSGVLMRRGRLVWFYQDYIEMFHGRPIETWLARHALRWHRGALVLSNDSKVELENYVPGKEVAVVAVGLSHAEHFNPLPPAARDPNTGPTILYLGDMRPRKGLFDFLEAARLLAVQIPNLHLWIVSKDECQISTSLPYTYIYRPSREELARLMATCDLYVSASWWESFGIPPLEAMACGAPVVATDSRGVRDFGVHGENCLIVPPRRPAELAEAMRQVLTDPELAQRLRRNGPPTAARFTWQASVERFESGLQKICPEAPWGTPKTHAPNGEPTR